MNSEKRYRFLDEQDAEPYGTGLVVGIINALDMVSTVWVLVLLGMLLVAPMSPWIWGPIVALIVCQALSFWLKWATEYPNE